MIKNLTIIAMLLCFSFSSQAQNFYYSPEGKTHLEVSTQKILIQFKSETDFQTQKQILSSYKEITPMTRGMMLPAPKVTLMTLENVTSEAAVYDLLKKLATHPQVEYANHFLAHKDGTLHGIMNRVLVGLKTPSQYADFAKAMRFHPNVESFTRNEFEPLLMEVVVKGNKNALEVANSLQESNVYAYAEPDFLRIMKRFNTNDPNVDSQWSLDNDGNNTSPWGGIAGADMNVYDAWGTTTGDASVKVAILDEGVDLNHPDLVGNMLGGFDATGLGSGGDVSGDDAHGTACAGIVAAVGNNNTGGVGVAYSSKIVPVRIAYSNAQGNWVTSNTWIGNALNWSWNQGDADILSNSWGGGGSSSAINNAIDNAISSGRGGLGSPVLFAAGNDNGANSYPATYAPTISVIAMSMCNERKSPTSCDGENFWGSNFGAGADIAAPGVKIFATDISGSAGYSGGDYTSTFNGTSSATPNAAGVMALILSADNSLTEAQARFAIESTTDKVGGYNYNANVNGQPNSTWSNDLGYGRVNAASAVSLVAINTQNDAGISAVTSPTGNICVTNATPELTLRNFGSNTLTSVTINYSLDGGANSTFAWTGSLAQGSTTTVTLPNISFGSGNHTLAASTSNPNGQTDENANNDGAASSFSSGSNDVTLTINFDNYPEETSWTVVNAAGGVVASGGNYGNQPDGSTLVENFCLADGCFDFTMNDAASDGLCCGYGTGSYVVTDAAGNVLASGAEFAASQTTNFCVPTGSPLAVTMSATDVQCFGDNDGSATATASGGSGNFTYTWNNGGTTATITNLPAGAYSVTVNDGTNSTTGSVTVQDGTPNTYYLDADGDGFGDSANTIQGGCFVPNGYVTNFIDCDDTNAAVYPNAPEICDGLDNNCNGQTDEEGLSTYYADSDSDGFGDANNSTEACSAPAGFVANDLDCDDTNANVNPNATEICDGIDNNCNGQIDENGLNTYYADTDSDGFGDANNSTEACSVPAGYVANDLDCDDTNASVNPNATEICDGIDNNCNGQIDENGLNTFYADTDSDGFGDANNTTQACFAPAGYVANDSDCDDTNASVNPNATEVCDGVDNNCNGQVDEGVETTYYADTDGDGFGDANNTKEACSTPTGYVTDNTDCDDTNANIFIGATCDDNDANTTGDVIDANCNCTGTPVNTGCTENEVTLNLILDGYPQETSWQLTNAAGAILYSGGTYGGQNGATINETFCLPDDCYDFTIDDTYGDGICCAYGNGSYSVTDANGNVIASGGTFTNTETTNFCLGSVPLVYCGSEGTNTNYEFIDAVEIADLTNTSGNDGGYGDYTNLVANVNSGATVSVTLTPGFASTTYAEAWKIWIDYNQDGDFDDAGEEAFAPAASSTAVSGNFTIPANALSGATRMRVSMKWRTAATTCESFTYGEVEDYTIVIDGGGALSGGFGTMDAPSLNIGTVGKPEVFTKDTRMELGISLSPNPVNDVLTVKAGLTSDAKTHLTILNVEGKVVFEKFNIEVFENTLTEEIQVEELPSGIYFIRVVNGEEMVTERFSKMK